MRKTYLARRDGFPLRGSFPWGSAALFFALVFLLLRLLAPNAFLQTFAPALRAAHSLSARSHAFLSSFGDVSALALQNEQLSERNAALAVENQALAQKAESLAELLGDSTGDAAPPAVLAGVLARPPESPYDTLVVAVGENAGVTLGMGAFALGGAPIGVVSAVTGDFARVTLFSAPRTTLHGWVGRAHSPLEIRGMGAGALGASIARLAGVVEGDVVFAPGPGALPIGSVARIDGDPSAPEVTLRIVPVVNPFTLTWITLRDIGKGLSGFFSAATSTLP